MILYGVFSWKINTPIQPIKSLLLQVRSIYWNTHPGCEGGAIVVSEWPPAVGGCPHSNGGRPSSPPTSASAAVSPAGTRWDSDTIQLEYCVIREFLVVKNFSFCAKWRKFFTWELNVLTYTTNIWWRAFCWTVSDTEYFVGQPLGLWTLLYIYNNIIMKESNSSEY